jgi:hypothetical protein
MTIGSPIDKHLYLWPEIFLPYGSPQTLRKPWGTLQDDGTYKALAPISWQNYYDYGDPVAHRLDRTRRFLRDFGWNQVFEFEAKTHDHGFARYPFPGQAHLDYWDDADVFGHFIQTVVKPPAGTWHNAKLAERFTKPPATRRFVSLFSRVVPYLLAFLVLLGGFALLYHATRAFAEPELHNLDYPIQVWLNILGFTSLLAGITVVARVARLNRRWSTLLCSLVFWAIGLGFYYLFTQPEAQRWAASVLLQTDLKPSLAALAAAPLSIPASYIHHWSILDMFALSGELPGRAPLIECRLVILGISLALVFLAYVFSYRFPHWGAKTLIIPGCLIIAVVLFVAIRSDKPMSESSAATDPHLRLQEDARLLHQLEELYEARRREWSARHPLPPSGAAVTATRLAERERSFQAELGDIRARLDQRSRALIERRVRIAARGSVLPLLLSAAAFLYLWWIAIILFDMTFVWHRFIRGTHTSVEAYFDRIIDQSKVAELPPTSTRQGFDPGI